MNQSTCKIICLGLYSNGCLDAALLRCAKIDKMQGAEDETGRSLLA